MCDTQHSATPLGYSNIRVAQHIAAAAHAYISLYSAEHAMSCNAAKEQGVKMRPRARV